MSTQIELKSFKINTKIEILAIKSNYYSEKRRRGMGKERGAIEIDLKIKY